MLKKVLCLITILTLLSFGTAYSKDIKISDVQNSDESYVNIQKVLSQNWMSLAKGKFLPDKYITRSEFSVVLTKFNGQLKDLSKIKTSSFADVKISDLNAKYINLQKSNITSFKNGKSLYFKPKNYISREDALAAIAKIKGLDDTEGEDYGTTGNEVDISEVIEDSAKINPALENLVITGINNDLIDLKETDGLSYLNPKGNITRRQLADLLVNANNVSSFNVSDSDGAIIDDTTIKDNSITKPDTRVNLLEDTDTEIKANLVIDSAKSTSFGFLFRLDNNQIWELNDFEYISLQKGTYTVDIYKDGAFWYMLIDGVDKRLRVSKVK